MPADAQASDQAGVAEPPRPAAERGSLRDADVSQLYQQLLGRDASPEEVESQLTATSDWRMLLSAITASEEYLDDRRRRGAPTSQAPTLGPPRVNIWHEELAALGHRPGTWSADGEAVMGHRGWIFLGRGSNSVLAQYQPGFGLPDGWYADWVRAVRTRRDGAAAAGAALAMLIVPDKVSVLREHLPADLALKADPPASLLAGDPSLGLLYPRDELAAAHGGAFLRTDTHLSLAGNAALATAVLEALGSDALPLDSGDSTVEYLSYGDLGNKFVPPVLEVMTTRGTMGAADIGEDNLAEMRALGRHVGTRRVLHNGTAADARTAVVFGDSYSMAAEHYQGLAWHLAQRFAEVHFVWTPFGWDADYVARVGAAVVVCEIAERFVPRPPSTHAA